MKLTSFLRLQGSAAAKCGPVISENDSSSRHTSVLRVPWRRSIACLDVFLHRQKDLKVPCRSFRRRGSSLFCESKAAACPPQNVSTAKSRGLIARWFRTKPRKKANLGLGKTRRGAFIGVDVIVRQQLMRPDTEAETSQKLASTRVDGW